MWKMTLISIIFRGNTHSKFVKALYINDRTIIPASVYVDMAYAAGCSRGQTFTIG